jgi:hypothetical protein
LIIDRDYNSQIVILKRSKYYIDIFEQQKLSFQQQKLSFDDNKINTSMENDVLRRISMCKGIFQDKSENRKFIPEQMGSIPEKVKKTIRRRKKK